MEKQNLQEEKIIDIEEYAKEGKVIPEADQYRIRIDKQHYVVRVPEMTVGQLLALAGKQPPERFSLYQKLKGGETRIVELDQTADFRTPGVERFMTLPLDQTEGAELAEQYQKLRRHFELPEDDVSFLERLALPWETVNEGSVQRVVLYSYKLSDGYKQTHADLNLRIERTYPDTQIDTVYFFPPLVRTDGKGIKAVSSDRFDGKDWQRWSRHRTSQNPWRPGIDGLETHIILVGEWLKQELRKV